ncbi:MAG: vitamin B12 dependent-methionine synthase activation domain-containing protein [Lachnospiraceae bacterium]
MNERTKEAIRYLGYGSHTVDDKTLSLILNSFEELELIVNAKIVYRIFKLSMEEPDKLQIGSLQVVSKDLARNLKGCKKVALFGATLGIEVDRLMRRYGVSDTSKMVVLQACATAMLEEFCDEQEEKIKDSLTEICDLSVRFSPGYGDFPIQLQKEILQILDATKQIGLSMTDSYMLTPVKSVTAVIGIRPQHEMKIESLDDDKSCVRCTKADCEYKRRSI